METEQRLYLDIIAYGLSFDSELAVPVLDGINWEDFYVFCKSQAILGIGLQCIEKLKNSTGNKVKIPQMLLLQWIGIVEQIRVQNRLLSKRTKELTEHFREQGLSSCILKGQGNALMYPNPEMRTPGDIDVWLEGTKKEVVALVHQRFPYMNVQYHHMDYPIFDDVEVEVHYYPSYCYNKWHNYRLQHFFKGNSDKQFNNINREGYATPTVTFNLVFQLSHMMRHFFTQGIGLRHVIDYHYLLQQNMSEKEKIEAIQTMKRCGMLKFFRAILWIEKSMFGLNNKNKVAKPHERAGRMVLHEMLKGGNFGNQYSNVGGNYLTTFIRQMVYNARYLLEFPSEPLSRPLTLTFDYINKRIRK